MSNRRKKEIGGALYSPTTAAHATANEEKQKNTKSLGKIFEKYYRFHMLNRCVSSMF